MQDAYYWPLTPSKCVTVWVAIDDIDEDNGPMQFVPGSHLHGPIHHNPSDPDEHNVLNLTVPEPGSWGDGSVTTISPLRAGQASLHSDLLLHSSDANSSSRRRCGVALTYHTTDVRLNNPDARAAMEGRSFVCRGVDVDGRRTWRHLPSTTSRSGTDALRSGTRRCPRKCRGSAHGM